MRIMDVTNRFADLQNRSGCYMRSSWNHETQTQELRNTYGDRDLIAEIFDYKNSTNFRLRLHPHNGKGYNRTSHSNRVHSVLRSIQAEDKSKRYTRIRYCTFIRYGVKVYDSELKAEYDLSEKPMEFSFVNGKLTLDYRVLESNAYPNETPTPTVELNANSNLQSVSTRLTNILQGV